MDFDSQLLFTALLIGIVALYGLLRRANEWIYVGCLGTHLQERLPPGHLGLPLIGNMWSLIRAFKFSSDPESFITSFANRYGTAPMYRALLFGNPAIIVTTAEECRKVLTDERFKLGYPRSLQELIGKKSVIGMSDQEWKRVRQMIQAPIAGQEALSTFVYFIKGVAETSFQEWAKLDQPIELLTEMRKHTFKALMKLFLSNEIDQHSLGFLEREYNSFTAGLISMSINFPGFAYHKALKARKNLVKIFQEIIHKRRAQPCSHRFNARKDFLDQLMEASDDSGNKLSDEVIVSLQILLLFAGHETTSLTTTWTIIFLEENPHVLQKAKEEQQEIVKRRTSPATGLTFSEIKEMKYLRKVIKETLRLTSIAFAIHREAKTDINLNGYLIPKGWKVLAWIRNIHFDPENYDRPKDFNPSRWDDHKEKARAFLPFGAGSRFCPGSDLGILQISIYLHYFLLNYRVHRVNAKSKVEYLISPKPVDNCLAKIRKVSP